MALGDITKQHNKWNETANMFLIRRGNLLQGKVLPRFACWLSATAQMTVLTCFNAEMTPEKRTSTILRDHRSQVSQPGLQPVKHRKSGELSQGPGCQCAAYIRTSLSQVSNSFQRKSKLRKKGETSANVAGLGKSCSICRTSLKTIQRQAGCTPLIMHLTWETSARMVSATIEEQQEALHGQEGHDHQEEQQLRHRVVPETERGTQ